MVCPRRRRKPLSSRHASYEDSSSITIHKESGIATNLGQKTAQEDAYLIANDVLGKLRKLGGTSLGEGTVCILFVTILKPVANQKHSTMLRE